MPDPSNRPAPLSVRLSPDERARLERDAAGISLGSYIRSRLFDPTNPPQRHRGKMPVKDQTALAQVLGLLGQSRIASNLNQLARGLHTGTLPLDDELASDLRQAVNHVAAIRRALIEALNLSAGSSSPGSQ